MSTSLSTRRARNVMSSKLPIGVATTESVPLPYYKKKSRATTQEWSRGLHIGTAGVSLALPFEQGECFLAARFERNFYVLRNMRLFQSLLKDPDCFVWARPDPPPLPQKQDTNGYALVACE